MEEGNSEEEHNEDKEQATKEGVRPTEENNLMGELKGNEDEGRDLIEEMSEPEVRVSPWRQGTCGRMCKGMWPLDAPDQ